MSDTTDEKPARTEKKDQKNKPEKTEKAGKTEKQEKQEKTEKTEASAFRETCMAVLRLFYFLPYEGERDFYLQYRRRLKKAERLLLS